MYKNTFFICLKILFLLNLISITACEHCQITENGFDICERSDLLVSVDEISHKNKYLQNAAKFVLVEPKLKGIAANAFVDNISISEVELSFIKNSEISLNEDSFRGLKQTRVLKIKSGYIPPVDNLFKPIELLTELELIVNENHPTLKIVLRHLGYLKTLKIHNSILNRVNADLLSSVWYVSTLEIKQSNISEIEPKAFSSAPLPFWLTTIRLHDNNLQHLWPKTFEDLNQLTTLEITGNNLTTIKYNVFNALHKLQQLDISRNAIKYIESRAFEGLNLQSLNLAKNDLKIIMLGMFGGLITFHLDLSKNPVIEVERNAFGNTTAEFIYASNMDWLVHWSVYGIAKTTKIMTSLSLQ